MTRRIVTYERVSSDDQRQRKTSQTQNQDPHRRLFARIRAMLFYPNRWGKGGPR